MNLLQLKQTQAKYKPMDLQEALEASLVFADQTKRTLVQLGSSYTSFSAATKLRSELAEQANALLTTLAKLNIEPIFVEQIPTLAVSVTQNTLVQQKLETEAANAALQQVNFLTPELAKGFMLGFKQGAVWKQKNPTKATNSLLNAVAKLLRSNEVQIAKSLQEISK